MAKSNDPKKLTDEIPTASNCAIESDPLKSVAEAPMTDFATNQAQAVVKNQTNESNKLTTPILSSNNNGLLILIFKLWLKLFLIAWMHF